MPSGTRPVPCGTPPMPSGTPGPREGWIEPGTPGPREGRAAAYLDPAAAARDHGLVRCLICAAMLVGACSVPSGSRSEPAAISQPSSPASPRTAPAASEQITAQAAEGEPQQAAAPGPSQAPTPSDQDGELAPVAKGTQPQSAEECRAACRGQWGRHGLARVESCLCRTTDSGTTCQDGADCQGECIVDEAAADSPLPPAGLVGRCSEFVMMFGCWRRIPKGAPISAGELPPKVCLD
jgi:hypothetical protein